MVGLSVANLAPTTDACTRVHCRPHPPIDLQQSMFPRVFDCSFMRHFVETEPPIDAFDNGDPDSETTNLASANRPPEWRTSAQQRAMAGLPAAGQTSKSDRATPRPTDPDPLGTRCVAIVQPRTLRQRSGKFGTRESRSISCQCCGVQRGTICAFTRS